MPITGSEIPTVPQQVESCHYCSAIISGTNVHVMSYKGQSCCTYCTLPCGSGQCSSIVCVYDGYTVNGYEGGKWCRDCTLNHSEECAMCRMRHTLLGGTDENPLMRKVVGYNKVCPPCFAKYFWICGCAPRILETKSRCPICSRDKDGNKKRCPCGLGNSSRPIHNYSCKPTLVFHGKSKQKIHMGFELETRIGDGRSVDAILKAAVFAMERLQHPEIAELKDDSSIGGGFEIVTQPGTYEHFRDNSELLWDTIDTLRKDHHARSWDAKTCGLHIHIARNAFRDGLHTHRFIEFIYRNSEMLSKFAGRYDKNYASFHDCWKPDKYDRPQFDIGEKLKMGGRTVRHTAVNTQNETTIELRFFRGTMKPSGVRSALGLAHAMVQYTRTMVPDVEAPRDQVFAWAPFAQYVEEHAEEYADLMERMPLIKDVDIDRVPNIDA